jgi:uncharacterized protein DUF3761
VLAAAAACFAVVAVRASADGPPGATARCNDGTFSFSTTHSGTCSHHGGVAMWLDGSGSSTNRRPPTTVAPSYRTAGPTVALGARTRTAGCKLGALPDRACSPGAYYSGLTKDVICSPSFRTAPIRHVAEALRHAVEIEYGLSARAYGSSLEIDHIVSLELGGSNDISNLYPERAAAGPGFHVKDRLENRLHDLVCSGAIGLRAAQQQIASNWIALYRNVYGEPPAG